MMPISLKFKGPHTLKELELFNESKKPGIYVWGILDKNSKFIPHYVGEATSSILGRINRHIGDILSPCSTYRRLHNSYLDTFYFSSDFPLFITGSHKDIDKKNYTITEKQFIKNRNMAIINKFAYSNSKEFWKLIDKHFPTYSKPEYAKMKAISPDSCRSSFYWREREYCDYLSESINSEKFKVFFAELPQPKYSREELEIYEAAVKFLLKGRTNSESISISEMINRLNKEFKLEIQVKTNAVSISELTNVLQIQFENPIYNGVFFKHEISYDIQSSDIYGEIVL